jgi:hypothetical protein
MLGDLAYINVKILEQPNAEVGITCSTNGFFRNDSSVSGFSAAPSTRFAPCYSYTLAGCLNQVSQQFSENLQVYLKSILTSESYFLSQPLARFTTPWIVSESQ